METSDQSKLLFPEAGHSTFVEFTLHKRIVFPSVVIIIISLLSCLFSSWLAGLSVTLAFALGIFVSFWFVFRKCEPQNLCVFCQRNTSSRKNGGHLKKQLNMTLSKTLCPVCGDNLCDRFRPALNIVDMEELMKLKIPENIDQAIEEFLTLALSNYVYNWYSTLTMDEAFMHELRSVIRHALSVILHRAQKVDLISFITNKLFHVVLQHIDAYLQAKKHFPDDNQSAAEATLQYLGSHQHVATRSRNMELFYLRYLTEAVMNYLTPFHSAHCRVMCCLVREILSGTILLPAMDVIGNPDYANHLILIFLSKDETMIDDKYHSVPVHFLENFCHRTGDDDMTRFELAQILKDQTLLFPFMQFLKTEGSINILNFCLSIEDFNKKMLNPDLKAEELQDLHQEALNIFKTFCAPNAPEQIHFESEIVQELEKIVFAPYQEVEKLRMTPPLFQAYEYAYNLLETMFCPLFPKSDEYFAFLYGNRLSSKISRSISNSSLSNKNNGQVRFSKKTQDPFGAVSKLGNKIKGVFRGSSDEKVMEGEDSTEIAQHFSSPEDEFIESTTEVLSIRDLSAWRVSIPHVQTKIENGKLFCVFVIDVQRIDVKNEDDPQLMHWVVERRYNEFYVLENKLIEFHGKFPEIHLPPQKTFGNKDMEFMKSKKQAFEDYLKKLLSTPSLRGSDLLYNFLKSSEEFTTGFLPDINIGKMFKNVPMRLLKGKMQHLDSFIQSFVSSTEAPKPKPSKVELSCDEPTPASLKLFHPLFTYHRSALTEVRFHLKREDPPPQLNTIYDYLTYIATMVFKVSGWSHHILLHLKILGRSTLDVIFERYLQGKLELLLKEQKIVSLVHLLQDAIFFDDSPPRNAKQKRLRAHNTLHEMLVFFPWWVKQFLGETKHKQGVQALFDMVQHPHLNKQLVYTLLDLLMVELFPELTDDDMQKLIPAVNR